MNPNLDHAVLRDGAVEDPALRFSRRGARPGATETLQEVTDHAVQAAQA
jgi:hypothetical protein